MMNETNDKKEKVITEGINDHDWSVLVHLAGLCAYVLPGLGGILITFLIWYLRKDNSKEVDIQGREALNFEIAVFIYAAIAGALTVILVGFLLLPMVIIFHIVFSVIAAKNAKEGRYYRYPAIFRLIEDRKE